MNRPECITLEGLPPTTNHAYGVSNRGGKARMYKTTDAKAWQEMIGWQVIAQRTQPHQDWQGRAIRVMITLWSQDRRADIDGGIKLTLDAIAKGLGFNDKMVDYVSVLRFVRPGMPEATEVYIGQDTGEVIEDGRKARL
jgi:Holliday junction resolvase RusA-like endonuclease